jgi:polyisoprenoid-binding protein YceI
MRKKTMLLALAAISAAMISLPAVASANWGVDPSNASFSGTAEGVGSVTAAGEPTITCEGPEHITGAWSNGTDGSFEFDATNCHLVVVGFTINCRTTGSPLDNTVSLTGTFKNVTITSGKRGILLTPTKAVVQCGATKPISVEGNVVGEITEPTTPCPNSLIAATFRFVTSGGSQVHKTIDGSATEFDLTGQTEGGSKVTGTLQQSFNVTFNQKLTATCNNP